MRQRGRGTLMLGRRAQPAAAARGDVIVSLSAHSLPAHERWLANLVRNFADARVAGVYGRQIPRATASVFDLFGMALSGSPARAAAGRRRT